ncbi:MAG TPA: ABC transporter permease [Gemmatimonadaceae bacterium]|nr:ABC transporter permease [Gemmatimonadaceae bacterium]
MLSALFSDIRYRVRALFSRPSVERELDAELRFHLEREAEKYQRLGLSRDDARRRASIEFGGVERTKDASRDARGTARLESVARDLRYAVRSLRSRPAFTLTVVGTLALGIGANTAIFTLVDALLLRPLPVSHPEQLAILTDPAEVNNNDVGDPITAFVSYLLYKDVRARNTVFTDMYASGWSGPIDVSIGASANAVVEQPHARFVTGNFFSVLGVPAYIGRTFTAAEDETPGQDPVAVITYDYWQRRFSGSRAAIGSVMRINDVAVTIIGVTPAGFGGDIVGQPLDFWLPMMMDPEIQPGMNLLDNRAWQWLMMMGRLKPGVSLEQAGHQVSEVEANAIRENLSGRALSQFDDGLEQNPIQVVSGARGFSERRAEYAKALWVLMAAVGLVILVVCANVSSLMLARVVARRREMTVRMTLGADRRRLVQQLLVEAALLAIVSSALGLVAATWGGRLLLTTVHGGSVVAGPVAIDTALDARVLAFTGATTLACVLLFGLLPAFRATRVDLATALRSQGRNLMGAARVGRGRIPLGRALVVAQIALSMLLLIGGGLLVRSMQQLLHGDIGADRDHLIAVRVRMSRSPYVGARLGQFRRALADRVGQVPGVDAAAFADRGLFSGGSSGARVDVSGFVPQADSERVVSVDQVGPNFFHAIGAHLIRGRDIDRQDLESGPPAVVINETMAKKYFGARDPLGATVTQADTLHYRIVGVVRDFQNSNVRGKPRREMYIVFNNPNRGNSGQAKLVVHVRGDPSGFVGPIRRAVEEVDRTLPIAVDPVNDLVRGTLSQDVLLVQVTICFCLVTLVLAALGLYGVTAYSTSQRTSEFGLRVALGAEPRRVTGMVLGEAARIAFVGILVGVPAGLAAARLIQSQLFGVSTVDGPSLMAAVAVLAGATILASYLPARRAARVGPLEALRVE